MIELDRRNSMLVSRVACLGPLDHSTRGFSGPLSRHLLAYRSIISDVRASLRDLIEMCLVSLFLENDADRNRDDWMDISLRFVVDLKSIYIYLTRSSLPFYEDTSCALGIIVKTYLDELNNTDDPTSEVQQAKIKELGTVEWLRYGDFQASFDTAMKLWDAVSGALQELSKKNLLILT